MSWTPSVDVVGPNYWSYMASMMADALQGIISGQRVTADDIPRGIHRDAVEFFKMASESTGEAIPVNPPASINAYVIAADVLRSSAAHREDTRANLAPLLGEYLAFIQNLLNSRALDSNEIELAKKLREFFNKLHEIGEQEAYVRRVRLDPANAGLRSRLS